MNQTCKVCGEPAAGFHFGAFTCEGCKSFFGRSYNNLSSISECKNNGECTINKKNRTACKACRLRKCLMVGMSKSGSRYGRRSNWFKIHCLLQEQQQQAAAAAAAAGNRKTPPPTSASINMLGHSNYPQSLYPRPACTKEELMLLGFDEYNNHNNKHPSASPSVSSPDSHNSDSSVEIGDRRQSLLRQTQAQQQPNRNAATALPPPPFNKELFLPLTFPGLMPPPGFLPPSHLMFPGYHPALYAQHQGLLKSADPSALLSSAQSLANNNSRFVPNNNNNNNNGSSKTAEELTKRYLDAVLKSQSQCSPNDAGNKSDDEDMDSEDIVVSMTPPISPQPPVSLRSANIATASRHSSTSSHASTTTITTSSLRDKITGTKSAALSPPHRSSQDAPIDLSMKSSSTTVSITADDQRRRSSASDDEAATDEDGSVDTKRPSSTDSADRSNDENSLENNESNLCIKTLATTTPLDLTTKV